eukprot:751248-Pelagomonas_calceolata.AAC.1
MLNASGAKLWGKHSGKTGVPGKARCSVAASDALPNMDMQSISPIATPLCAGDIHRMRRTPLPGIPGEAALSGVPGEAALSGVP